MSLDDATEPLSRRRPLDGESGTSSESGGGSWSETSQLDPLTSYQAPIVLSSNPWTTWVAWLSSALVCAVLCGVVFVKWSDLWYLAVTLGTFAVALAFQAKRESYTFDLNSGRCTVKTLSVLGPFQQQYWFHEIKEVRLEESTDTQGGTEVDLYLVLRSGRKIPVLASHLCGLEAAVKRQAWSEISEYLHVSKTQNSLEFLEEAQSSQQAQNPALENEVEMKWLR